MSERRYSIARRLIRRLGILFLVAIFCAGLLPFVLDRDERSEMAAKVIQEDLERLAQSLRFEADGRVTAALPADAGFGYRVLGPDGTPLIESGPLDPPPLRGSTEIETARTRVAGPSGPLLLEVTTRDLSAASFWLAAAMEWGTESLPLLILLLVGVVVIGVRTIADSMAPLGRLADEAAGVSPGSMDRRLGSGRWSMELAPLVASVNAALDRLEEGFRHQRQFTADAAHELRTPLAVLSAHLDTLSDRATAAALRQDMAGMSRLVDQLLAVAELDSIPSEPPVTLDLPGHVRELAASMAPFALKAGRPLAVLGTTGAVPIRGHPEAIRRALRNLIENAVQHAPRGSTIEIEVTDEPAVHVLDRGPGIPADMHSRVRQRFWRGDRSRDGGAGLGLAIVERIAEAENARLVIGDREGGGADISLVFASAGR